MNSLLNWKLKFVVAMEWGLTPQPSLGYATSFIPFIRLPLEKIPFDGEPRSFEAAIVPSRVTLELYHQPVGESSKYTYMKQSNGNVKSASINI